MSIKKSESYFERNGKKLKVRLTTKEGKLKYERKCLYCMCDFISNRKTSLYCCDSHRVSFFKDKKKREKHETTIALMRQKLLNR